MATWVTKIIDPDSGSGYDYTSLAAWESDQQDDITAATGSDEIHYAKVRSTGGTADTSALSVAGWTTAAGNYILIQCDPAESYLHDGKWNTAKARLSVNDDVACYITEDYVLVKYMQIETSGATANYKHAVSLSGQTNGANYIYFYYNICRTHANSSYYADAFNCAATVAVVAHVNSVYHCRAKQDGNYAYGMKAYGTEGIRGCTVYGGYDGITSSTTSVEWNTAAAGAYFKDFLLTTSSRDYCASEDATADDAGGSNCSVSNLPSWTDSSNTDFHLESDDTACRGNGDDLSGYFTDDIDRETRSAWDIGADEYSAGTTHEEDYSGSLTPTGSLTLLVLANGLAGGMSPSGAVTKQTNIAGLAGSITPAGGIALAHIFNLAVEGTIALAGTLGKVVQKALTGGLTPSGILEAVSTGWGIWWTGIQNRIIKARQSRGGV